MTADGTAAEQQRVVDDLLTKGVDAIAISPVDPQNQTALIDAAAKRRWCSRRTATRRSRREPATSAPTTWPRGVRPAS